MFIFFNFLIKEKAFYFYKINGLNMTYYDMPFFLYENITLCIMRIDYINK